MPQAATVKIIIIGAGPTGLTAALELARRGIACRIVDKKSEASTLSRAVGINPRSLALLKPCGVTQHLLEQGIKVKTANIHKADGRVIASLNLSELDNEYNFLLSLPQDQTENIMRERLKNFGLVVEYGAELVNLEVINGKPQITLKHAGSEESGVFDVVIAADGAHSIIRQKLEIPFIGHDYQNLWSIADFNSVNFNTSGGEVNLYLHDNGKIGFIINIGLNRYRAISNTADALNCIPGNYSVDKLNNNGTFHIAVRQCATYQKSGVYLAGDAAHTHSPAGGRGMNLGIEDACELARLFAENNLAGYTRLRHPAGAKVIKMSERLVFMATRQGTISRHLRNFMLKIVTGIPFLQKRFFKNFIGA